jgi:hypothetical protein
MLNLAAEGIEQEKVNAYSFALAGLARLAVSCTSLDENVHGRLNAIARRHAGSRIPLLAAFRDYCRSPQDADR